MNHETQLKIQAFADNELPAAERRELESLINADSEAKALLVELQQTAGAMTGNEPFPGVPLTREFYWNRIERDIERLDRNNSNSPSRFSQWLRWLAPAGACAALAIGTMVSLKETTPGMDEVETPLEQGSVYSFRSPSEKMSIVWVQSEANYEFTSPDVEDKAQPENEK